MRLHALVLSLLVACGGAAPKQEAKTTPDPIPKTAGPGCKDVTAHLATLADRDPAQDAKADGGLRGHCESDRWSDEARSCFATASSDDEVDGCKTKLTAQQQAAFPKTEKPEAAAAGGGGKDPWATPKDGGKHKTRGYVPKDKDKKTKDSDPCEGGE